MSLTRYFATVIALCGIMGATTLPAHASTLRQQLEEAVQDYQFQDFDAAGSKFRAVLRQAPGNVTAHYYLGIMLLRQGKAAEAIPHLKHVAASPANYNGIDNLLANAYLQTGQTDHALPIYEKLYRADPKNDANAFNFARVLQSDGQNERAKTLYQSLIDSGGNYADASRYQLAQIYVETGAYSSAVKQLNAIAPDSPQHPAADRYLKALTPVTRPFNVYLSTEFFYSDNPTSASVVLTGTSQAKQGSQGLTLVGMVNSRNFELTPRLLTKVGYLFYGNFYREAHARSSDFQGHFLNPELSYHPSPAIELTLKGELQSFYFNKQWLSNNVGATLTGSWHPEKTSTLSLHGGYLTRHYTSSYIASGIITSLKYLDANVWSFGTGGSLTTKDWNTTLGIDYTFNDERPTETGSAILGSKARDSRTHEHVIRANLTIPLRGVLKPFRLLSGYSYSSKNFLYTQSGSLYTDVAGQKIGVHLHTFDIKLQADLWKKISLKATAGFEYSRSSSASSILNYAVRRYYGQLSAYY